MRRARRPRGFTLIEVMMVVSIVGVLSSVAIPEFQRLTLRAKTTERRTVMAAISRAMSDLAMNQGRAPSLVGDWNPAVPGVQKQRLDTSAVGWRELSLTIEGQTYYSYGFVSDPDGTNPLTGKPQATLDVTAVGDLDGDGVPSPKTMTFVGYGHSYQLVAEAPLEGWEDAGSF